MTKIGKKKPSKTVPKTDYKANQKKGIHPLRPVKYCGNRNTKNKKA